MSENVIPIGVGLDPTEVVSGVDRIREKLGEVVTSSNETRDALGKIGEGLKDYLAGFVGFEAVREGIGEMIAATERNEQAQLKLGAVIKATGDASGIAAGQMKELAEEMQKGTLFKSEDIMNAEAVMSTYRSITGATFTEAIKLSADLASVWDMDVTSAARQVGRALEDPQHGLMALTRAGVTFNNEQREQIKNLAESGDLLGAQTIILDRLKSSYEGVAETMHSGLKGLFTDIKHDSEDLLASLGSIIEKASVLGQEHELMRASLAEKQAHESLANAGLTTFSQHSPAAAPQFMAGMGPDESRYGTLVQGIGARDADAVNAGKKAADDYVESIKEQISALQGVTKEERDFAAALEATHTALQRRQVIGAYNDYGIAALGARPMSHLTGDITDPGLAITNHVDNQNSLAAWESGALGDAGFSDREIANAGGGRSDGMTMQQRFDEVKKEADAMERQITERQRQLMQQQELLWIHLGESMSSTFANTFDRALQGQVKNFRDFTQEVLHSWSQMLSQMAARQAGADITKALMGAFGKGSGGDGNSVGWTSSDQKGLNSYAGMVSSVSNAVAAAMGGGGQSSSGAGPQGDGPTAASAGTAGMFDTSAGNTAAATTQMVLKLALPFIMSAFHRGGVVGVDSPGSRWLSSMEFAGAPKFHDGGTLASDEVPAILQKGETVLTPGQMAALGSAIGGGGGGETHVHFHVQAIDSRDVAQFFDENKGHIAATVADSLRQSRGMGRTVQRRM
jgi:hypothetical protein